MSRIKRLKHVERPVYFVTTNTHQRRRLFANPDNARIIVGALEFLVAKKRIDLFAHVIMPDHLHLLIEILDGRTISQTMHSIKSFSAQEMKKLHMRGRDASHMDVGPVSYMGGEDASPGGGSRANNSPIGRASLPCRSQFMDRIWHRSFYDHVIKNDCDLWNHVEYIKRNPVQAGLADCPAAYTWLYCKSSW